MVATTTSPNTGNLSVGKGIVSFLPAAGGYTEFRDIGEVREFEITLNIEQLDHFSQRSGTREKDLTVVLERGGEARMMMEEWTPDNIALMFMGSVDLNAVGGPTVTIMTEDAIDGRLRFQGNGDVGPKWDVDLYRVRFIPSASINMISDEWAPLEVTGEILRNQVSPEGFGLCQLTNLGEET